MKHVLFSSIALLAAGCAASSEGDSGAPGTSGPSFEGAPLTELSSGECPKLDRPGERSFTSDGLDRTVIVHFPKDPEPGLPVLFAFHGLGDSAAGIDAAMRLEDFARDNEVIVVVPQSTDPFLLTWDIGSGGKDAVLYDDMRTCLVEQLGADLEKFSVTGFSFGALFATWLTLERGDTLASAAILSGGTDAGIGLGYRPPASDLPVLVMWGGDNDVFDAGIVKMDFAAASVDLADHLQSDGHLVARCEHQLGHTLPGDYAGAMTPWVLDHRYGEASPYEDALPDGFPAWCSLP